MAIEGNVGGSKVVLQKIDGSFIECQIGEKTALYAWERDDHGIILRTESGVFAFDVRVFRSEAGEQKFDLIERITGRIWSGLAFTRDGERFLNEGQNARGGLSRVAAEMPGRIVKVHVKVGDSVQEGDPLLVMEAMKMENIIFSPRKGWIKSCEIEVGKTVEAGAPMMEISDVR